MLSLYKDSVSSITCMYTSPLLTPPVPLILFVSISSRVVPNSSPATSLKHHHVACFVLVDDEERKTHSPRRHFPQQVISTMKSVVEGSKCRIQAQCFRVGLVRLCRSAALRPVPHMHRALFCSSNSQEYRQNLVCIGDCLWAGLHSQLGNVSLFDIQLSHLYHSLDRFEENARS